MTADLIVKAVLDLEPGEEKRLNGVDICRWRTGLGWTVFRGIQSLWLSSLPAVVDVIARGRS